MVKKTKTLTKEQATVAALKLLLCELRELIKLTRDKIAQAKAPKKKRRSSGPRKIKVLPEPFKRALIP